VKAGALVGAEQQPLAFLARVAVDRGVGDLGQLAVHGLDLGHRLGHQIVVLDGHQGELDASHRGDFPPPEASGVDDEIRLDGALLRDHLPAAAGQRIGLHDRRLAMDGGAQLAGRRGEGLGGAGRVHVAALLFPQDTDQGGGIQNGGQFPGLVEGDELGLDAQTPHRALEDAHGLHLFLAAAEHEAAGVVEPAGLAALLLQLGIELEGIFVDLRDRLRPRDREEAARRVPGRARRELLALDEHHVRPARLRQVVEHATAGHTAADHHHLRLGFHPSTPV
jgi:hypothetical protein